MKMSVNGKRLGLLAGALLFVIGGLYAQKANEGKVKMFAPIETLQKELGLHLIRRLN